jgi:recombination protein RecR
MSANASGSPVSGHTALDRLVALLSKLPGIGKKSASRMAYHILDGNSAYAHALAGELSSLHQAIRRCRVCGGYTETDPCPICSDPGRDRSLICVVERAQDISIMEESREFNGVFHVLGGLIAPLEGLGPGDLAIGKLVARLKEQQAKEIILALNPTVEGDTTALYLQKMLKEFPVEITRLASGLPVGGDLEYTDRLTLSRSFRGRVKV